MKTNRRFSSQEEHGVSFDSELYNMIKNSLFQPFLAIPQPCSFAHISYSLLNVFLYKIMEDIKDLILNLGVQLAIDRTEFCKPLDINYSPIYY